MKSQCMHSLFLFLMGSSSLCAGNFIQVHKDSSEYEFVERVFQSTLEPLYGDQTASLQKIADEKDRVCELFCEEETPVGILVYKTHLVQEFALYGIRDALEIKTLFVIDAQKNSGKGTGSCLVNKVLAAAKEIHAHHVVVTVSEEKPEALQFFLKKGFRVIHTLSGKYVPGVDEYVLTREA